MNSYSATNQANENKEQQPLHDTVDPLSNSTNEVHEKVAEVTPTFEVPPFQVNDPANDSRTHTQQDLSRTIQCDRGLCHINDPGGLVTEYEANL